MTKKDTLYRCANPLIKPFQFDQAVVDVFPDMIERSVPGYPLTVAMTAVIANQFAQAQSNIYDLGCALGAISFAIANQLDKHCHIIALDNSPAMINHCRKQLAQSNINNIEFVLQDIHQAEIVNASMVVMNFTLQFIPLKQRLELLQKIYSGLLPGGVFILSEKIIFDDRNEQETMETMHEQMKFLNGYERLEIAKKRQALESILFPETVASHRQRLKQIGFKNPLVWLQCFNFVSLLAIK